MQEPTDFHFAQINHILWYIKGTLDYGQFLNVNSDLHLTANMD